mmetsp:Transcript_2449/g.7195  ORF Transcript_2449/g.7195 Transcript_2449/m.7195 type:complete len:228 (+) Transcript_2449:78-761(+)
MTRALSLFRAVRFVSQPDYTHMHSSLLHLCRVSLSLRMRVRVRVGAGVGHRDCTCRRQHAQQVRHVVDAHPGTQRGAWVVEREHAAGTARGARAHDGGREESRKPRPHLGERRHLRRLPRLDQVLVQGEAPLHEPGENFRPRVARPRGRRLAVPGAALGEEEVEDVGVAALDGSGKRARVPGAAARVQPLEDAHVALPGGEAGRLLVPRAAVVTQPLQGAQLAALSC